MVSRNNRTAEQQATFIADRRRRNAESARRRRENLNQNEGRAPRRSVPLQERDDDYHNNTRQRRNALQTLRRQANRHVIHDIHRDAVIQKDYLGKMDVQCQHCSALHFKSEKVSNKGLSFNDCCSHGTVELKRPTDFPPELFSLFNNTHPKSNDFFINIRAYNNSLSFASFNANLVNFRSGRRSPYCFKVQGQIYYQINTTLNPCENEPPSYGQLFFIDQNEAIDARLNQHDQCDHETMTILDRIIREHNIFAKSYNMMREEIENQRLVNSNQNDELVLLFSLKPGLDRGRYNFQRTNEVAAIFSTTADGEIPESYVTIRNKNTRNLKCVSSLDPNVEAWIYPLFNPFGEVGWHVNMLRVNNNNNNRSNYAENRKVTRLAYTKYKLAIRENEFNPILMGRRLTQQWVVDAYVKIEKDRIQYCKDHQKELRTDTYQGLHDYLQTSANDINAQIGKTVILPSSFQGSPRHMQQCYQDAMAIVNETGKPDIFLTMTCCPRWPEIVENLLPGQQPSDRPDLIARVFHLKAERIRNLIVKEKLFGEVASFVYVIEFQKRGLPHMHMLITLKPAYKINVPDVVDTFISAEIPDKTQNPELHDIVVRNMMHACGDWCKVDNKCSKKFPKAFENETKMDEDGYPHYRRRNNIGEHQSPNGHSIDNSYVVPYCPKLLQMFNCHINVEIVTSIRSVKYLYKYVYKGHDAASVIIGTGNDNGERIINHDEIRDYLDARYVGPSEACYRILSKSLHGKSHSIQRLVVHLPGQHNVIISNDNENLMGDLDQASSLLLDYFKLNSENANAREYLYGDIPRYFVHKKQKIDGIMTSYWSTRKAQFNTIGRMYSVNPTNFELFHLRLLLLHVKGATSFNSLRTVDGVLHDTFTSACLALGLIEDDQEWTKAMEEGALWMMPGRLRQLFVRILVYCNPLEPQVLWEKFKDAMSEDFSRTRDALVSNQIAYAQINELLIKEGRCLADYPTMEQITVEFNHDDNEVNDEINQSFAEIGQSQYLKLNVQQKQIVDTVLNAVENRLIENNCMYIDGVGGSGKTYVYTTLYKLLSSKGFKVCSMAFTGIAATLLPNGKTVHKTFGLPVPIFNDSSSNIKAQSKQGIYLKNTDVFIWDEAPMAPRYALEIINKTLQHIMGNSLPFGGKMMILGGDFRQLLPIVKNGTRNETLNLSIKYSQLWQNFIQYKLTTNMRVLPNEIEFAQFLLNVGDGNINDNNDNIPIPDNCILPTNSSLVDAVFKQLIDEQKFEGMSECAILAARNVDVDEINKQVTNLLNPSTERIYTGVDSTENCNNGELNEVILPEYLNLLNPSSLPPYELRLRKNCIVMLIRNISISEGLCNGTRLRVLEFSNHLLKCKILTGDKANEIVFLNRITLYCDNDYPFTFKRRQFPVKLAFGMTINKSQGQTFKKIGIDLRRDVFSHGQMYVAMSRVRSWDALKIYLGEHRDKTKIKNFVYKELYF